VRRIKIKDTRKSPPNDCHSSPSRGKAVMK